MHSTNNPPRFAAMIAAVCISLISAQPTLANSNMESSKHTFLYHVFLDEKEIGHHAVSIDKQGEREFASVSAIFDIKFLFFSAYQYKHHSDEVWSDQCLSSLKTWTIDNGEDSFVSAIQAGKSFNIKTQKGERQVEGCIKNFEYWDIKRMQENKLLNTQSGQVSDVEWQTKVEPVITIDKRENRASEHSLVVDGSEIKLWYGQDDEWLGLQTRVAGGKTLTYYRHWETKDA